MSAQLSPALCSLVSQGLDESAFGSAAHARVWLCLEQNGPWGRSAATDSHLDPEVGTALDDLAGSAGGRFVLVRRPGRHADDGAPEHRRHEVLIAWSDPQRPWLLRGWTEDPRALLDLDPTALATGDRDALARSVPALELALDDRPELLVCTNGRRDLCCAVRGRPVAQQTALARPGQVWETSHTGGHRFAPTAVLLPSGVTLARLDADLAVRALDGAARGELPPSLHGARHDRGRSALTPAQQAAESQVREETGVVALGALSSTVLETPDADAWVVQVRSVDGRRWRRTVRRVTSSTLRRSSCSKAEEALSYLVVQP